MPPRKRYGQRVGRVDDSEKKLKVRILIPDLINTLNGLQKACMSMTEGECVLMAGETRLHCTSLNVSCVHAVQVGGQPRRPVQGVKPWVMKGKKRSEVDRRLDTLVGPSGKLKDGSMAAVIGMLRLFNLCDVAPTITQADLPRPGRQGRAASPVPPSAPAQVPILCMLDAAPLSCAPSPQP